MERADTFRSGQYARWRGHDFRVGPAFHLNLIELVDEVSGERHQVPFDEVSDLRQVETFAEHEGAMCKVLRVLDDRRWLLAANNDHDIDPAMLGFGIEEEGQPFVKAVPRDQLTVVQAEELPLDVDDQREQRRRMVQAQLRQWDENPEILASDPELRDQAEAYREWLVTFREADPSGG